MYRLLAVSILVACSTAPASRLLAESNASDNHSKRLDTGEEEQATDALVSFSTVQDPPAVDPDEEPDENPIYRSREGGWFILEYQTWWLKGNHLPPLVTTSPAGTARNAAGVIGQPGTEILFGDSRIDTGARNGLRVTLGTWLDESEDRSLEVIWFSALDDQGSGDFFIQSPGLPIVARPYFDTVSMQNASELTAFTDPGNVIIAEGWVNVRSSSGMQSGAIDLRHLFRRGPRGRVDLLTGYRYFRFRESLTIDEQVIARDPGGLVALGTVFDLRDRFATNNVFHGGELGFDARFDHGFAILQIAAKVAMGHIQRRTDIMGRTVVTSPTPINTVTTTDGALLAQPTNSGRHIENDFAVLPEISVNLQIALTDRSTLTLGYTVLALDGVARTGEQIDPRINSNQIGGGPPVGNPLPQFAESCFWAQAVSIGLLIER